uniref:Uncharacterized protein n=1 Tax=Panagrolaimus sp. ES5 TaxID=591445 RepID=A0AC34GU29_9BILA
MEEFVESPMLLLQCGIALAVPAVLTAIVNLGCGKKRDQPIRPGGKKDLSKSKPGGVGSSSKSAKSKRSTKSAGSGKKTGKASSSKRSSKSIDKSGKSGKNSKKSSKSSKGSKSSKSKRSKRDVKLQQTGPPSSQRSD